LQGLRRRWSFSSRTKIHRHPGATPCHGSVVAGHREAPTLGRQHCAQVHKLVFSIEAWTSTALTFDLRASTLAFCLPSTVPVDEMRNLFRNLTKAFSGAKAGMRRLFGFVGVYYIRKGNILWNVRVWGGIKEALKQLPECHTTQQQNHKKIQLNK